MTEEITTKRLASDPMAGLETTTRVTRARTPRMRRQPTASHAAVSRRPIRSLLAVALLFGALSGAQGVESARGQERAPGQERSGFTTEERAMLERGQLVVRPHRATSREPWIGGVAFQAIDRQVPDVWRALSDLAAYRYMLPGTDRARDDGLDGGARLLYVHHAQMGVTAEYSLRLRLDSTTQRVEFELDRDRAHDIDDARGFVEIRTFQRTRTLVTWGVRAAIGMGALEPMVYGIVEPWILRVPTTMKQFLEGRARDRYRE